MAARAHPKIERVEPQVVCVAAGGCGYLRTLSTIEHLAGFEHTAKSYAAAAAGCQKRGCWAAKHCAGSVAREPRLPVPIPFKTRHLGTSSSACARITGVAETIPFSRSALLDIVSDQEGNYIERRSLKLDSLPGRGDPLGYLYDYWRGLRAETACEFSNIDTVHLMRAGIIGKLHIVDVASSDPEDFRFDLFGYAIPLGRYEKPRALPVPIYADTTMRDYNTVRLTGAPRLHRVRSRIGAISYHYTRLILPFLDARGRVSRLLVAVRQEPGDGAKV